MKYPNKVENNENQTPKVPLLVRRREKLTRSLKMIWQALIFSYKFVRVLVWDLDQQELWKTFSALPFVKIN